MTVLAEQLPWFFVGFFLTGTLQECLYTLMCLGISPQSIPLSPIDGERILEPMQSFISERRQVESESVSR